MRELWATGWMHNRVRMIVGSFLVKNLLIPWQKGEEWFWDCLVDADIGANSASWQWIAGCGADAAPYFRIFNPVLQGERYDPDGEYVRRWVPELKDMPKKFVHKPWEAPSDVLAKASVKLGDTYPQPLMDHAKARDRALAAYQQIK
jgi:deoxyribodipyrimidine photo-lyase